MGAHIHAVDVLVCNLIIGRALTAPWLLLLHDDGIPYGCSETSI